jgi:CRISPR-associated protein Csd1
LILQALYQLYERLLEEPNSGISPPGYSKARVSHVLNLSESGGLLDVIDLRDQDMGRKLVLKDMDVPRQVKRTSGVSANFMCDNSGYVFGVVQKKGKPVEISGDKYEAMRDLHEEILGGVDDLGARALLGFLRTWNPEQAEGHPVLAPIWDDLMRGGNIVFKLDGTTGYIHQTPAIRKAWESRIEHMVHENTGQCLITGKNAPIAKVHDSVKGVVGAQSSGAALVSFNLDASTSYGKKQSINAPVSEEAAFAYVTALNYLLRRDQNRLRIGDTTTVFWAEQPSYLEENILAELLDPTADAEVATKGKAPVAKAEMTEFRRDPQATRMVRDALAQVAQGRPLEESMVDVDKDIRFYILGLSPNNARLSVRYWHVDTFGNLLEKIGQHYSDMAIALPPWETGSFAVWTVVNATAPLIDGKRDGKSASPLLGGALTRAVLLGTDYPHGIYTALLGRIRADQEVSPVQAAMIKACLVRHARISGSRAKEENYTVSLNEERTDAAYLLGRLFAVLEKAQQDAASGGKLNATIRDRYFGAASATPQSVFPVLLRLAQHHIAKSEYGGIVDRQVEAIIGELDGFPTHLNLEEQGDFIIGYYHQRQAFYIKKPAKVEQTAEEGQ